MSNALEKKLEDSIELTEMSEQTLQKAVETIVENATSRSKLVRDIEIGKWPSTGENQPYTKPNVKIKVAYGDKS